MPPGDKATKGMAASRFASKDQANPFYGGPLDPRHRDPTALLLETSSGKVEAKPVQRTYQTWHRVEETDSKIIFHLDEINVLVKGVVKNKDGTTSEDNAATVTPATANLSIVLDKVLVFGRQNLNLNDKGYLLEDDSVLAFKVEGSGTKGREAALTIGINNTDDMGEEASGGVKLSEEDQGIAKEKVMEITTPNIPLPDEPTLDEPRDSTAGSRNGTGKNSMETEMNKDRSDKIEKDEENQDEETASRSVLVTGLPDCITITKLLKLIKPTKNTLVIEIQMTKSLSALLQFYTPQGAQDLLNQYPDGFIPMKYEDPGTKMPTIWKAKLQIWGEYVPVKEQLNHQISKAGATRYLRIIGRGQKMNKDLYKIWTIDDYRNCLGREIYDGNIYHNNDGIEIADLEFMSIKNALFAHFKLRNETGFAAAQFRFYPDPHVLRD